jgi:hypothetical protein
MTFSVTPQCLLAKAGVFAPATRQEATLHPFSLFPVQQLATDLQFYSAANHQPASGSFGRQRQRGNIAGKHGIS